MPDRKLLRIEMMAVPEVEHHLCGVAFPVFDHIMGSDERPVERDFCEQRPVPVGSENAAAVVRTVEGVERAAPCRLFVRQFSNGRKTSFRRRRDCRLWLEVRGGYYNSRVCSM